MGLLYCECKYNAQNIIIGYILYKVYLSSQTASGILW